MDSTLEGDYRPRKGEKATTIWLGTAAAVLLVVALAVSASMWLPALLGTLSIKPAIIAKASDWLQLGLWLLAALLGAVGVRRALDDGDYRGREDAHDETQEAEQPTPAGTRPEPIGLASAVGEIPQVSTGSSVSFYTSGGVRIIAEDGILDMDEDGELALVPFGIDEPDKTRAASTPGRATLTDPDQPPGRPTTPDSLPSALQSAPLIATPFNLPADLPDFTGRETEMAEVRRLLGRAETKSLGDGRMLAISGIAGMGGIGKTALALHVAHQMAQEGHFPDAQLYIDLKGTASLPITTTAALKTLLTALLGADAERPDDEDSLARLWRGAMQGKQALIILDNALGAPQVRPLLPGSPTCTVLVTSRQRFSLPGAHLVDLNRLPAADARALLQGLAPRLDDATADAIAERCGGLPLALRIAGNYLALNDDLAPAEYAARLADERGRLAHLRDPQDPDLDVVATLSLSVGQLHVGNRWAWSMLSLFPVPFDASAAAAAWGEGVSREGWSALDEKTTIGWLSALRNRSLVTYDPNTDRYRLHDLLHLAASQELEDSEDADRARARLAYHFLNVALEVDRNQCFLDLDPDWPHLRAALAFAKDRDPSLLSELVLALDNYWSARGMADERAHWSEQAAQASAALGHDEAVGVHLASQGVAFADRGDASRAIEVYGRALTISRAKGDQRLEAALLGNLGQSYQALGDARRAVHFYEQALEIARAIGLRRGESVHMGDLGTAYMELGDARQAIEYLEQALLLAQELGDRQMEGTHLGDLGQAYADLGDVRQAITRQKEALAIHRQIGNLRGETRALDRLGRAYADLGQPDRAIDYYEQALEITRSTGDRRGEGADLSNLGLAYTNTGDADQAINYHRQALSIAQDTGDRRREGICLGNLGTTYLEQGQTAQAVQSLQEALRIARQVGDRRAEATWLAELGEAHSQMGELAQAAALQEQALAIYQEIGDRRSEGNRLASLGLLARRQGDKDRAHEVWTDALRTLQAVKDPSAGRVWQWLADLEGQPAA